MHGALAVLDTRYQSFKPSSSRANNAEQRSMVLDEFKLFADLGGGESARLVDEEKVIKQMVILVFGSRWEVCLDEFMKNL
jgi:hypothetical protein